MRRGEVWTVSDDHGQHRVVVLSGEEYNVMGVAYCAPIMQRSAPMQPYTVALVDPDPIAGTVLVGLTEPIGISTGTESIGIVTGVTMARLSDAVRDLFDV
jgi:mRNA interferase MazF